MAKIMFGMNQSLDGYVDHDAFGPDATLFSFFIEQARGLTGSIYGRRLYEIMRYWDEDRPEWTVDERAFAEAWRALPKWVVSRTLRSVGPNATLLSGNLEQAVRDLKASLSGTIEIGGPELAASLGERGLIDEYRLYVHPVVLGSGRPYFAAPRPPLRFVASEPIGNAIRLTYVPA